jgi:hypothetical protein
MEFVEEGQQPLATALVSSGRKDFADDQVYLREELIGISDGATHGPAGFKHAGFPSPLVTADFGIPQSPAHSRALRAGLVVMV